jgi:hypothetical protein
MRPLDIKTIRIHPAIGIARLGNSPDGYFIGPEIPGVHPKVREYRDPKGRLNRQAARFRLFAYDKEDDLLGEVTAGNGVDIQWTVHLRNTKAAGRRFAGILHQDAPFRNQRYKRYARRDFILDGKPTSIRGVLQQQQIECCNFMRHVFSPTLRLGTLITEKQGRLLVLGGHGRSGSLTHSSLGKDGDDFANHDGWFDDTSDGSVRAVITWKTGKKTWSREAIPSWVIVAPPKYAPTLQSVVSLYDVLYQLALDSGLLKTRRQQQTLAPRKPPHFLKDIYPILRRAYEMRWVFARANVGHQDEIDLCQPSQGQIQKLHQRASHIVRQFRNPSVDPSKPGSGGGKMPYVWSDFFDLDDRSHTTHPVTATLTRHQYEAMQAWADNDFCDDWGGQQPPRQITPEGLDRAALEPCVGAAMYPGIEASFHIRNKFPYIEPFRLDADQVQPGDVTQQMSIPWQTDFVDCSDGDSPFAWWPAQRPIDVHVMGSPSPVRWARDFGKGLQDVTARGMVRHWWRFGLLTPDRCGVVETLRIRSSPKSPSRKRR